MVLPPPSRRTPRRVLTALAAVGLAVALAACGSDSSADAERPSPEEAASVIRSGFGLDEGAATCLQSQFEGEAGDAATTAMLRGSDSSDTQREALSTVLDACISAESFADAVAVAVAAAVPGSTPERDACLRREVLALGPDERGTVMLGLVLSGDTEVDDLQTRRAEIVQGIYDQCGVSLTPATTDATPS
jgi:hypothetical protein